MQPYRDAFLHRRENNPRVQKYLAQALSTMGERGEFLSPEQQDLWGQMRFNSTCIENLEQRKWWSEFISRHNGSESAPILDKAASPCELYMCYFEFSGVPCMVVPFYKHRQVGVVQGIVKLNRAFGMTGFNGIYEEMNEYSEAGLWYDNETARWNDHHHSPSDTIQNMGIMLLAQICKNMDIELLFASPIHIFRHMLLVFIENHNIGHWLGNNRGIMDGGDLIHVECNMEEDFNHIIAPWWPQRRNPPSISRIQLLNADDTIAYDLGFFLKPQPDMFPMWDIIHQKWNEHRRHLTEYIENQQLNDFVEMIYPHNFLQLIAGEGMVIMKAGQMALYAPIQS